LVAAVVVFDNSWVLRAEQASAGFWLPTAAGSITRAFSGDKKMVLCMQGRRVVMQVEAGAETNVSFTARFFCMQREAQPGKRFVFRSGPESVPDVRVGGERLPVGAPAQAEFDGRLTLSYPTTNGLGLTRTVYPSMTRALVLEEWQVLNSSGAAVPVSVLPSRRESAAGDVALVWNCPAVATQALQTGSALSFATWVLARPAAEPDFAFDLGAERSARRALAEAAWHGPCRLETPEPLLDAAFVLQKLHVLESPIDTFKGTITHNGSLTYSPGVWANDPVEYSSPLFPFFGDAELNRAGINMYRVWLDHCRTYGIDPFPGSFEGETLKLVQRERGDGAMVLYGLSKFLLFLGDRAMAEELWPLVEYSAASVLKHTRPDGIVASRTDEMEGRYPTGDANLSTSALAYGGYRLAASLAASLNRSETATDLNQRADALEEAMESCFGAEIEGYETYRYYAGNTTLRGWILLPMAMGITNRQEGTVAALLSDKLWPDRGRGADILAESTRPTEWGRETYYALRVLFKAGRTEAALDLTRRVVETQIFGSKGPYPDEDAIDMLCPGSLYPRVFTEGMFGIVPTGLDSFECTPWLPQAWPSMALRDVRAFGRNWDLVVERDGGQQKITVTCGGSTVMTASGPAGKKFFVRFPGN
jgi:hypothetical protein